jgi:hypothetical protein
MQIKKKGKNTEGEEFRVLWDIPPCFRCKINRRFGVACRQAENQSEARSKMMLSFDPKMETVCSSETSDNFKRSTRNLHNDRCENLKSYTDAVFEKRVTRWMIGCKGEEMKGG